MAGQHRWLDDSHPIMCPSLIGISLSLLASPSADAYRSVFSLCVSPTASHWFGASKNLLWSFSGLKNYGRLSHLRKHSDKPDGNPKMIQTEDRRSCQRPQAHRESLTICCTQRGRQIWLTGLMISTTGFQWIRELSPRSRDDAVIEFFTKSGAK